MPTDTNLPRITRYGSKFDHGPCDDGATATCPHCGASGRYVHHFTLEDGTEAAAMSGCIKLFPMSPVASADMALREKEAELAKKGWKLNSWQTKMRASVDAFYAGDISEADCLRSITMQKAAQANYRAAKNGGRRY